MIHFNVDSYTFTDEGFLINWKTTFFEGGNSWNAPGMGDNLAVTTI